MVRFADSETQRKLKRCILGPPAPAQGLDSKLGSFHSSSSEADHFSRGGAAREFPPILRASTPAAPSGLLDLSLSSAKDLDAPGLAGSLSPSGQLGNPSSNVLPGPNQEAHVPHGPLHSPIDGFIDGSTNGSLRGPLNGSLNGPLSGSYAGMSGGMPAPLLGGVIEHKASSPFFLQHGLDSFLSTDLGLPGRSPAALAALSPGV